MNRSSILMIALAMLAASIPLHAYADTNADVATMAKIVVSLQHFPSDADKEALAGISAGNSDDSVKAVAGAIARISHKVSTADKATLESIAADESQSSGLRELASIVAGMNHMPGADAKASLEVLANR